MKTRNTKSYKNKEQLSTTTLILYFSQFILLKQDLNLRPID